MINRTNGIGRFGFPKRQGQARLGGRGGNGVGKIQWVHGGASAARNAGIGKESSQGGVKRVDLHCHSKASSEADEAALNVLKCPESYSEPREVYQQAKERGMDFVALTDHDCIDGALELIHHGDVLVGEELTTYFPEDGCKMHVLVWGVTPLVHAALQERAGNIYEAAAYIAKHRLAHAVAHPVYRQNDMLEKWHLERLLLMFKGFECLNGAHSMLHRTAFEPVLDALTPQRMLELSETHGMAPLWPEPHVKARTGGSDDHGLFNIGRTWTELPGWVKSIPDVLEALRLGQCWPGGESGSSLKLAHNFYSVGVKYASRTLQAKNPKLSVQSLVLQSLVGERPQVSKFRLAAVGMKHLAGRAWKKVTSRFGGQAYPSGTSLLMKLFMDSFGKRVRNHQDIWQALKEGKAPLALHQEMFDLVGEINRDVSAGIAKAVKHAAGRGQIMPMFDAISAVAAQQFLLLPYYFAMFHQNRERKHFGRITGHGQCMTPGQLKVGVFTDTLDQINGVSRWITDMANAAHDRKRHMVVHTCGTIGGAGEPAYRKNFVPMLSMPLPQYPQLSLAIPDPAQVMEWADRQQFDVIHVETPGPMGLMGVLAGMMLQVPVVATYHTDFPAYVRDLTGDFRLTSASKSYMGWFYSRLDRVLSRSKAYMGVLPGLGISPEKIGLAPPCVDTELFSPVHADDTVWSELGISKQYKVLCVGRVSKEKNLGLLLDAMRELKKVRNDVELIVVGDGPNLEELKAKAVGLPVTFAGVHTGEALAKLYASADMLAFPSLTDTMGQVVLEAQASGLAVLVSDVGGPRELMADGITGWTVKTNTPADWARSIDALLSDDATRLRMGRSASHRMRRFDLDNAVETVWKEWAKVVAATQERFDQTTERQTEKNGAHQTHVDLGNDANLSAHNT